MINNFRLAAILLLIGGFLGDDPRAIGADEASPEARFRSECLAGHQKLRERFANCSLVGIDSRLETSRERYKFAAELARSGERRLVVVGQSAVGQRDKPPAESVNCLNPDKFFRLTRQPGTKQYLIEYVLPTTKDNQESAGAETYFKSRLSPVLDSPYSLFDQPFDAIVSHPTFRFISAAEVVEAGRKLIAVVFSCNGEAGLKIELGKVWFDPELDWAIRRYETNFKKYFMGYDAVKRGTIDYNVRSQEIALDRFYFEIRIDAPGAPSGPTQTHEFVVERFSIGPLPPERFELPAFGLPDVPVGPVRANNWLSLRGWLFWGAIMAAVLAFVGLRLLRPRRAAVV